MTNYFFAHWIEVAGAIVSLIYLWFSIKQLIWLWPFGLLSAVFYIAVYLTSGFYADMGLQVYYVIISIYGWYHWSRGKRGNSNEATPLQITKTPVRLMFALFGIFLVLWGILWLILDRLTNSTIPFWDAMTTAGALVATWMLARKLLEHWLVWIVVDTVSLMLYIWKELYATVILFVVYAILAVSGYIQWKKSMEYPRFRSL